MSVNARGSQWLLEGPNYCCTQHVNTPVDGREHFSQALGGDHANNPGVVKLHAIVADLPTLG